MKKVLPYILLCLFPVLASGQSTIGCFVAGECFRGVTGLITSQPNADACLDDCKTDPLCLYFTYDTDIDACIHLSACESLTSTYLTNLFTGHASCDNLKCGNLGHCDGSIYSVLIADTIDECFNECAVNTNCEWWTYSFSGDKFCSLYENCPRVDTSCDYCLHGQRACENVTRCIDPWESYPGTSKCVRLFDDRQEYGIAQAICRDAGENGNLITINSQVQQDFIEDLFAEGSYPSGIYIGLNDMVTEGDFQWLDGTPLNYTNWNDDEPNDDGTGEDVVHLWPEYGGKWNDVIETYASAYACQIDRQ